MRRLVFLVALLGLVASACASSSDTLESAAAPVAAAASDETIEASTEVSVPANEVPTPGPEPVVYETGRDALEASQGKPYVLWFWAPN